MEYLIDSDASIDYLHLDPEATAWVESLIPAGVSISIVTLMESYQGTFREPDPIASQAHYAEYLRGIPVLPFLNAPRNDVQICVTSSGSNGSGSGLALST